MTTPIPLKNVNLETIRVEETDSVLERAKSEKYESVVVLGIKDGEYRIQSSTMSDMEIYWLLGTSMDYILHRE